MVAVSRDERNRQGAQRSVRRVSNRSIGPQYPSLDVPPLSVRGNTGHPYGVKMEPPPEGYFVGVSEKLKLAAHVARTVWFPVYTMSGSNFQA